MLTTNDRNYNENAEYFGHQYICIKGDAETPARMWQITLYTEIEFQTLSEEKQNSIRRIRIGDLGLLEMHFPYKTS